MVAVPQAPRDLGIVTSANYQGGEELGSASLGSMQFVPFRRRQFRQRPMSGLGCWTGLVKSIITVSVPSKNSSQRVDSPA